MPWHIEAEAVPRGPHRTEFLDAVLIRLDRREPTIDLAPERVSFGSDDGCGGGSWCATCRAEARAEAFQWLHALSEAYPMSPAPHGIQRVFWDPAAEWEAHRRAQPTPSSPPGLRVVPPISLKGRQGGSRRRGTSLSARAPDHARWM